MTRIIHCILDVERADGPRQRHCFGTDRIVFGRSRRQAELWLSDRLASRVHGSISVLTDRVLVTDLDSTNGTFRRSRVQAHPFTLHVGQSFYVGGTRITLISLEVHAVAGLGVEPVELGFVETRELPTPAHSQPLFGRHDVGSSPIVGWVSDVPLAPGQ